MTESKQEEQTSQKVEVEKPEEGRADVDEGRDIQAVAEPADDNDERKLLCFRTIASLLLLTDLL